MALFISSTVSIGDISNGSILLTVLPIVSTDYYSIS
jgi:hypothetical protein